ncbi:MAG: hypothetical protein DSY59_05060 [Persephonella sp.]|nr:MAG: hypothetical protein DSY59_05060 [Persephonella sp.]
MSKKYLFNFLETINTECKNNSKTISKKALKLDDERGLKTYLKINLSSCDYFYSKKNNEGQLIYLIEITDLKRQIDNLKNKRKFEFIDLENELEKLKTSNDCEEILKTLENFSKNIKIKEIKRLVREEFRKKTMESIVIIFNLLRIFEINLEKLKQFKFKLTIYLCEPLNEPILIDNLKNELKSDMKGIVEDIKIVPLTR